MYSWNVRPWCFCVSCAGGRELLVFQLFCCAECLREIDVDSQVDTKPSAGLRCMASRTAEEASGGGAARQRHSLRTIVLFFLRERKPRLPPRVSELSRSLRFPLFLSRLRQLRADGKSMRPVLAIRLSICLSVHLHIFRVSSLSLSNCTFSRVPRD